MDKYTALNVSNYILFSDVFISVYNKYLSCADLLGTLIFPTIQFRTEKNFLEILQLDLLIVKISIFMHRYGFFSVKLPSAHEKRKILHKLIRLITCYINFRYCTNLIIKVNAYHFRRYMFL